MKKSIRVLALIVALALFAAMALGSGSSDEGKDIVLPDSSEGGVEGATQGSADEPEQSSALPTIEEQVLFDQKGVKVTATEYVRDSIWGDGIKVLVENSSERNVTVSIEALIVNNYMIDDLFVSSVAAGKKANETIYFSSSELEQAGIGSIGQIELYFHVYDSDDYKTIFDTEVITIQTSLFSEMDVTPSDGGTELYNGKGIRIVGKLVDEDSIWGTAILLYLENTSGKNVTVSCENMSINGFMVDPIFSSTIYAGKMAIDEITIFSTDLEENDITQIEEVELTFHIYNADTYKTIVDTDPITFEVN